MDIYFLSGMPFKGHGTTEMRCVQPLEYLTEAGWSAVGGCIYNTIPSSMRCLVLHRVSNGRLTNRVIQFARSSGAKVIYDTDDLIFDSGGEAHLMAFAHGERQEKANFGLHAKYREVMQKADIITVSTDFLKSKVDEFHGSCVVMKNGLSKEFIRRTCKAKTPARPGQDKINIGYFSGSKHHDADFKIVEPALLSVLRDCPNVNLILGGKLSFSDQFLDFGGRFQFEPFRPYSSFIDLLGSLDINLAPLDVRSEFAMARSDLKYMEAGAFEVPTIASPNSAYCQAINSGINGLLCQDDAWYEAIVRLVASKAVRQSLGSAAKSDVLRNYGPSLRTKEWNKLISDCLDSTTSVAPSFRQHFLRLQIASNLAIRASKNKIKNQFS